MRHRETEWPATEPRRICRRFFSIGECCTPIYTAEDKESGEAVRARVLTRLRLTPARIPRNAKIEIKEPERERERGMPGYATYMVVFYPRRIAGSEQET
ncbi:hypothetical protein Hdeb2414_s0057g00758141 [Helianthus debilis subsp. tardiflorus]